MQFGEILAKFSHDIIRDTPTTLKQTTQQHN